MNAKGWAMLVIIVVLVGSIVLYWTRGEDTGSAALSQAETVHAVFICDNGGSIDATFARGETSAPADPNMPPTPDGSVKLALSDGREMTLRQTLSADGARYASDDESVVFWNVGNGATYMEGTEGGTSTTVTCSAQ
jgi:membrane-bound inhibitor of C-type lysozyme